jgi:hypothetical protein
MPRSKPRRKPGGKAVAHPGRGNVHAVRTVPDSAVALPAPLRHPEPMSQVLNVRHFRGFKERPADHPAGGRLHRPCQRPVSATGEEVGEPVRYQAGG